MKKFLGVIKKHKFLTVICLVLVAVLALSLFRPQNPAAGYKEEIAAKRDIVTYNSFVGNVGFTEEKSALAKASAEIIEVLVERGDSVTKGDVIAKLDSETLDETIEKTELSIKNQQIANEHTLADAQRAYDNFKYALDNGLNSNLNAAKNQKSSAKKTLNDHIDTYDEYVEKLEERVNSGFVPEAQVLISAKKDYEKAVNDYKSLKSALEELQIKIDASSTPSEADKATLESYLKTLESYEANVSYTLEKYESAVHNYCDVYDANLKNIVDSVENAATAYENSCESYDAVKLQLDQQLASYEASLQKAKDTLTTESAQKELDNLKDSLKNYQIVAPCDGIVTSLNVDEGDMVSAGVVAAMVSDLGELEISIKIDEYSILNTEVGKDVLIYIDSIGKTYTGTITWIANNATVAQGVSYFEATVEFNADGYVRGGMSVEVKLVSTESLGAVSVSVDAIDYREDNTAFVLVKDSSGALIERNVSLGNSDGLYVEITEGLAEGDKVFYIPSFTINFPMMG